MLFQRDWGIDTFGPVHAFELSLPILVLTIAGAKNLSERLTWAQNEDVDPLRWRWAAFAPSLLAALIVTAWLGFVPVRLEGVRQICGSRQHRAPCAGTSGPPSRRHFRAAALRPALQRRSGPFRFLPPGERSRPPQRHPVGQSPQPRGGSPPGRKPCRPHRLRDGVDATL